MSNKTNNGNQPSYNNERSPTNQPNNNNLEKENDNSSDPASNSFFMNDYKKHDDLKQMLDSNKDNLKLEAMKRIIGMVAKGRDASDLFPAVVKNVVSKNIEVKKLVYVYLTRYAEEQQDLALLSISTFQRALKDPNQLIRGSAIRVLSSIRVPMIAPIVMLSIKESVSDMSPYVRRAAAHAIPKLYCLDPEQKDFLIDVIEKLLADKTTLVAGSAIQAFEEVCPERIDLIHRNYRKLCNLLVDVEEWGQVVIINMLTRYCRTQFVNPNLNDNLDENDTKAFYESEDEEKSLDHKPTIMMDPDHRLLLKTCRPLLNSRNSAVVMGVAQLYHHCAPKSEIVTVAKALVRLLRSHKEVQFVVLTNIASMSIKQKSMFEPHMKSFYVRYNDPTHVKLLKLDIMTNLSTETNIGTVLREFQTYVSSTDKEFAAATIQAIGRCATTISDVTDTCLTGLVNLLSNRNEAVVGESVVVIKKLLQMKPTEHNDIVRRMAKMVDSITVPMAKASILWLIGEYSHRVPKLAPDVLRKMAKSFVNEEDLVKLQIMNLAIKLCIMNPQQTSLLCSYVLNLAKYDSNYDIRDRARFLRQIVQPNNEGAENGISKHAKKIFLASKPAPLLTSKFKDLENFQLGTLSHMIGAKANEYQELPDWPELAPDHNVRNVELPSMWKDKKSVTTTKKQKQPKKKAFYSDEESSAEESSSENSSSDSGSENVIKTNSIDDLVNDDDDDDDEDDDASGSFSSSETSSSSASSSDEKNKFANEPSKKSQEKHSLINIDAEKFDEKYEMIDDSEEHGSDKNSKSSEDTNNQVKKDQMNKKQIDEKMAKIDIPISSLLLDIDDFIFGSSSTINMMNSTPLLPLNGVGHAVAFTEKPQPNYNFMVPSRQVVAITEVLNRMVGGGVSVTCSFPRTISIFNPNMISIQLDVKNHNNQAVESIKMDNLKLGPGMKMTDMSEIVNLAPGNTSRVLFSVDFNDSTQTFEFDLTVDSTHKYPVKISPAVMELIRPNTLNEKDFYSICNKLGGMNENSSTIQLKSSPSSQDICNAVLRVGNMLSITSSSPDTYLFAAKSVSSQIDVLTTIQVTADNRVKVKVNCEKIVIGSMLLKYLKEELAETLI